MVALVATEGQRLGAVVKHEYESSIGYCRKVVIAREASQKSYTIGTVLGRTLVSGAAAAVAGASNTGNGTMGSITVSAHAIPGVYTLRITAASSNAGAFELLNANGSVVGTCNVASAFVGAGLAFTLADGATDFAVGDTFTITVSGTEKWKIVENTASDGSAIARGVYIGTAAGGNVDATIAATTDTNVVILERGPVVVAKEALSFGASINTTEEKNALYAQLAAVGIIAEAQI